MALTKAILQSALTHMRSELPCASVSIVIRGQSFSAIENKGITDAETSVMGLFPGQKGYFILTVDPPDGLKDGDTLTIERDGGRWETLRVVGVSTPCDGVCTIYYGDQYARGRVS